MNTSFFSFLEENLQQICNSTPCIYSKSQRETRDYDRAPAIQKAGKLCSLLRYLFRIISCCVAHLGLFIQALSRSPHMYISAKLCIEPNNNLVKV